MDVKTNMNAVNTQMNNQVKEVQPPKKTAPQSAEAGPQQSNRATTDKVTISAQAVEAQKNNEVVKGGSTAQTQKSESLVNTII